jgi:hypothetical protein
VEHAYDHTNIFRKRKPVCSFATEKKVAETEKKVYRLPLVQGIFFYLNKNFVTQYK